LNIPSNQLDYRCDNSERIERLRKKALLTNPFICPERGRLVTESYKQSEDKPPVLRKAMALKHLLERMSIYINEGELIVGNNASGPRGSVVAPEYSSNWLRKELDDPLKAPDRREQDRHIVSKEVKELLLREVLPFWAGKTVEDRVLGSLPKEIIEHGIASEGKVDTTPVAPECYLRNGIGHVVVDYEKLLKKGFRGMLADAERSRAEIDLSIPGNIKKWNFYEAVAVAYGAAVQWVKRYAQRARELESRCDEQTRGSELRRIAEDCLYISEHPPSSFRQALQTWFFAQTILFGLEQNCTSVSPGRFDQYMFPYYARDKERGAIHRGEAVELLQALFVKLSEMSILWDFDSASYWSGFSMTLCLIVGGVDQGGKDATNELSYLIIEADKNTGLLQPELAVRVHGGSPQDLLLDAVKEVALGRGKPKFFMDDAAISMIRNTGVSLEEARDYAVVGCVELTPSSNTAAYTGAVFINLAKCLELALNDGICFLRGERIGPATGAPVDIGGYDGVVGAFKKQVAYAVKNAVTVMNAILSSHAELYPCPFTSSLIRGCMERGLDFTEGGAEHNFIGLTGVGVPNVANSLFAVKKAVFEDRILTLDGLVEILKADFERNEPLRLTLWNNLAKYGNDDDSVDGVAREVGRVFCDAVSRHRGLYGNRFRPGLFAVSINVPFGIVTGASPDGRKAGQPLADGGISPAAGTEKRGPTAVIRSATKIEAVAASNGTLLNMRLSPSMIDSEERMSSLVSLLRTYNDLGGYHIQFNIVDNEVLRKAQKDPEDYRGLMVRVAGYSAYFVELNPEVQEDIISRTVHAKE